MPRSKNKQPKKLASLTQKELREINIQQESTKTAISKAAVARYLYIYPKMHFFHIYRICFRVNVRKYIFTQFQFSDLLGKFV